METIADRTSEVALSSSNMLTMKSKIVPPLLNSFGKLDLYKEIFQAYFRNYGSRTPMTQSDTIEDYTRNTKISIMKSHKIENKLTKFYLEFLLEGC